MWQVTSTAVQCVRATVEYSTSLKKLGSSGSSPTDIDIIYDAQKIGAGWVLYKAGGLTATESSVTTASNYWFVAPATVAAAPHKFSFAQQTIDFGAFLAVEPDVNSAVTTKISLSVLLAIVMATHF